jgi:hypothetical protein
VQVAPARSVSCGASAEVYSKKARFTRYTRGQTPCIRSGDVVGTEGSDPFAPSSVAVAYPPLGGFDCSGRVSDRTLVPGTPGPHCVGTSGRRNAGSSRRDLYGFVPRDLYCFVPVWFRAS